MLGHDQNAKATASAQKINERSRFRACNDLPDLRSHGIVPLHSTTRAIETVVLFCQNLDVKQVERAVNLSNEDVMTPHYFKFKLLY